MYLGYWSSITTGDTSECLRRLNSKTLWRKASCTLFSMENFSHNMPALFSYGRLVWSTPCIGNWKIKVGCQYFSKFFVLTFKYEGFWRQYITFTNTCHLNGVSIPAYRKEYTFREKEKGSSSGAVASQQLLIESEKKKLSIITGHPIVVNPWLHTCVSSDQIMSAGYNSNHML